VTWRTNVQAAYNLRVHAFSLNGLGGATLDVSGGVIGAGGNRPGAELWPNATTQTNELIIGSVIIPQLSESNAGFSPGGNLTTIPCVNTGTTDFAALSSQGVNGSAVFDVYCIINGTAPYGFFVNVNTDVQ
jgi:hypothetical protein